MGKSKCMASGGKTNGEMKSLGRGEAKLKNQFGGKAKVKSDIKKMAAGGRVVTRGSGAAIKGNTHETDVD